MKKFRINAVGHENILSLHKTTSQFTTDDYVTKKGDCIFAISADKSMNDLDDNFKDGLRQDDSVLKIGISCRGLKDYIMAKGSRDLILDHETDFVIRKSDFICSRTLAILADKAAADISRELIDEISLGGAIVINLSLSY